MVIKDSKSVKNTDSAGEKGYEAGKKLQEKSFTAALIPTGCLMRFG
jgi:hypothetical protein